MRLSYSKEQQAKKKDSAELSAANETIEKLEADIEDLQLEVKALRETTQKMTQLSTNSK